jgi:hypothetical protein
MAFSSLVEPAGRERALQGLSRLRASAERMTGRWASTVLRRAGRSFNPPDRPPHTSGRQ